MNTMTPKQIEEKLELMEKLLIDNEINYKWTNQEDGFVMYLYDYKGQPETLACTYNIDINTFTNRIVK